jgi:putative cell wall-binding protein
VKRALPLALIAAAAVVIVGGVPAWAGGPAPAPTPGPATPVSPETAKVDADATPPALPQLHRRTVDSFADQAKRLDPGLASAVTRDLHISPAQYLADAAAAQDAGALTSALHTETGAAVSATVDGQAVTVYTEDARTAALARAAGAAAVVGAAPHHAVPDVPVGPLSDVYGGQPYFIGALGATSGERCSAGFPGYGLSGGAPQLVSAGHCYTSGTSTYEITMTGPSSATGSQGIVGLPLGNWIPSSVQFGNNADSSLMALTIGHTSRPALLPWGGGTGAPLAGTPPLVTGVGPAVVGAPLCKSGSTTGWSCGSIEATDYPISVEGAPGTINAVIASTCSKPGDSGGAAVSGTTAVGLVSAGPNLLCTDANYFTAFYPMASATGQSSVSARYSSIWEPAVSVTATVAVTSLPASDRVLQGGVLSGTATGAFPGDYVTVKLANETTARTASILNGTWSVSLAGAPLGTTSYTANAAWGKYSSGPAVSGTLQITAIPTQRIAGADRFATSVAIAKAAYPTTAPTVYVATGLNYPDALSAAPAAAHAGGPLLLTSWTLPDSVRQEIQSLQPSKIVVVGGLNVVPQVVEDALRQLAPTVTRIAGPDRYATSQLIAANAFPGGNIPKAFIATGTNFPDALAAGAAAGSLGAPVLLVNGGASAIDAASTAFLSSNKTTAVTLVGGTDVITPGVQSSLANQGITVTRLAGADRFETAETVGRSSFPTFTQAYIASGFGFPDALAGSALAAAKHAPLFTVNGGCVPRSVLTDLAAQNVSQVSLLGGTAVLGTPLDALQSC